MAVLSLPLALLPVPSAELDSPSAPLPSPIATAPLPVALVPEPPPAWIEMKGLPVGTAATNAWTCPSVARPDAESQEEQGRWARAGVRAPDTPLTSHCKPYLTPIRERGASLLCGRNESNAIRINDPDFPGPKLSLIRLKSYLSMPRLEIPAIDDVLDADRRHCSIDLPIGKYVVGP